MWSWTSRWGCLPWGTHLAHPPLSLWHSTACAVYSSLVEHYKHTECCCMTVFCVVGTGIWSQVLTPFRCASESYSLGPYVQFSGTTTHARDSRLTEGEGFLRSEFGKCHSMIGWPQCSWAGPKVSRTWWHRLNGWWGSLVNSLTAH